MSFSKAQKFLPQFSTVFLFSPPSSTTDKRANQTEHRIRSEEMKTCDLGGKVFTLDSLNVPSHTYHIFTLFIMSQTSLDWIRLYKPCLQWDRDNRSESLKTLDRFVLFSLSNLPTLRVKVTPTHDDIHIFQISELPGYQRSVFSVYPLSTPNTFSFFIS